MYIKGVTVRFCFDVLELRKFKLLVKNKATGTSHGMYYIFPHWLSAYYVKVREWYLYTYIGVGLSDVARFDKNGNAKALTRGTSDRTAPRFFFVCISIL